MNFYISIVLTMIDSCLIANLSRLDFPFIHPNETKVLISSGKVDPMWLLLLL